MLTPLEQQLLDSLVEMREAAAVCFRYVDAKETEGKPVTRGEFADWMARAGLKMGFGVRCEDAIRAAVGGRLIDTTKLRSS